MNIVSETAVFTFFLLSSATCKRWRFQAYDGVVMLETLSLDTRRKKHGVECRSWRAIVCESGHKGVGKLTLFNAAEAVQTTIKILQY